jgi:predicted dehydrogenase
MRNVIAEGQIGRPIRASFTAGQWLPDWRPDSDYRTVYSADMARGGGVELDLSHEFDMARWFFGDLELRYVRGGRFSNLEITSNDLSIAVLEPAGGRGPVVTVTLDYLARQRIRTYEVIGDEGRLVWTIDGELELITADACRSLLKDASAYDVNETYRRMLGRTLMFSETGEAADLQLLSDGLASTRLAIGARDRARRLP